jgi:peptide/nickel transport system substrate-binding protein
VSFNRTRWPFFVALVLGITAVALFWYFVLENPEGEAVPASGGRYIEGVTRSPERINPLFASANPTDDDLATLIFSGLVRLGPDGTPQPDLAERWEITGNGQSYVFHLREGVAWHDGAPFTAADVTFTFDAISDPGFRGDPALAQLVDGVIVTARDDFTVEFRLEQAYAPFLAHLTVGILPEHLLGGLDAGGLLNAEFNARPTGTGPFRFRGLTEEGIRLERNGTYHLGPPHIGTFELRVFADDDALAAAAREGAVDGALLSSNTPDAELRLLQEEQGFAVRELPATAYFIIYLDTRSPAFVEPEVRVALMQGVSVPLLISEVAGGRGVPTEAGIAPSSWAYPRSDVRPFDPGAAASALERAGWSRGRDGVRRKGDERLAFDLSTSDDPGLASIAENVAKQWRAIGVEATVRALPAETFIEEHVLARQFQSALVLVDPGPDPDPYPFWHSSQVMPPGRNVAGYTDPNVDDVLERARQTTDVARRRELYELFTGYFLTAQPSIPLFGPVELYAQRGSVQGVTQTLLFRPSSRFVNVHAWYVRTRTVAD